MSKKILILSVNLLFVMTTQSTIADEFTEQDIQRWQNEYQSVLLKGEKLFHGGIKSKNTTSCDQCHPNATNTHPETYPKFQQQLGEVVVLGEMINWCIMNPLETDPLPLDSADMAALQTYITHERRGIKLEPGKH